MFTTDFFDNLGGSYEQVHSTGVEKDDFFTCHRRVPLISLTFPQKYDLPRGRFLENRLSPRPDNEFKGSHAWETTTNKVCLYFANLKER